MRYFLFFLLSFPLYALDKSFVEAVKALKDPVVEPKVDCVDPNVPLYCQDFKRAVCSDVANNELVMKMAGKKNELKNIFIEKMVSLDPSMKEKVQEIINTPVLTGDDDRMDDLIFDWAQKSRKAYEVAVTEFSQKALDESPVTQKDLEPTYNDAKTGLIRVIKELPISPKKKARFSAQLKDILIIDTTQFFSQYTELIKRRYPEMKAKEIQQAALDDFRDQCDVDGSSMNVFTMPDEFVYICPGMMVLLNQMVKSRDEFLNSMFLIFAHEFSHTTIDTEEFYPSLKACYQADLGIPDYDRFSPEQKLQMWDKQKREIGSDTLASRVLANSLLGTNLRGEALVRKLLEYAGVFCTQIGQTMDEEHPGASLRMEIFARHPLIRERMGCKTPDPTHKSCQIP